MYYVSDARGAAALCGCACVCYSVGLFLSVVGVGIWQETDPPTGWDVRDVWCFSLAHKRLLHVVHAHVLYTIWRRALNANVPTRNRWFTFIVHRIDAKGVAARPIRSVMTGATLHICTPKL